MRKILLGGVALTALAAAFPSFAADLPRNTAPMQPYYAPTPAFNWTGFYLGINTGYGFGSYTGGGSTPFGAADAGVFGGTVGYNYQINQFLVGLESDYDWTSFNSSKTYLVPTIGESAKVDGLWTLRGRAGYTMDNVLLFATGGYAGGVIRSNLTNPTVPVSYGSSNYSNGYAFGGGLEYAFTNAISVKAEYLYTSLDKQSIFGGAYATSVALHESLVRGGVDFHF